MVEAPKIDIPRVINTRIGEGYQGNVDTLSYMRRLARMRSTDPRVRSLALKILRQYNTGSHNYINECMAIGDFIKRNVSYVRDIEGVEQLHDPLYMISELERGRAAGDCDDMSTLIATLLLSIGAAPMYRCVRYNGKNGPFNHVYVVCRDRNGKSRSQFMVLDAIVKDKPIGYEIPHASHEDFIV